MGHEHEQKHDETPAEKAAREARERALEAQLSQKPDDDQGIVAAIKGFFKFLFEFLFGKREDAPNEEPASPGRVPQTIADSLRLGKLIIDANAVPKWQQFQRDHKSESVEFRSPVFGVSEVTSNFGHRHAPTKGASTNHAGVDLGARGGNATPDIAASAAGIVLFAGEKDGYGNTVILGHADGSYTLYAHMNGRKMPAIGAELPQGAVIGVMGATGTATATHLHYEQRKGDAAVAPIIAGVALHEGNRLASAAAVSPLAALASRSGVTPLPPQQGGAGSSIAFSPGASVKAAAVRGG